MAVFVVACCSSLEASSWTTAAATLVLAVATLVYVVLLKRQSSQLKEQVEEQHRPRLVPFWNPPPEDLWFVNLGAAALHVTFTRTQVLDEVEKTQSRQCLGVLNPGESVKVHFHSPIGEHLAEALGRYEFKIEYRDVLGRAYAHSYTYDELRALTSQNVDQYVRPEPEHDETYSLEFD